MSIATIIARIVIATVAIVVLSVSAFFFWMAWGSTVGMVLVSALSAFLIPFGIWGLYAALCSPDEWAESTALEWSWELVFRIVFEILAGG